MGVYTQVMKMESEKKVLAGAGGEAPGSGQAGGATAKSPIYLLEEVRKIVRQMGNGDFESFVEKIYKLALQYHEKYCDYPCFTLHDVREFLLTKEDEPFVLENEGAMVVTKAGVFGNLSYSHFLDSIYSAIEAMRIRMMKNSRFENIEEFAKELVRYYYEKEEDAHLDAAFVENLIDCTCPESQDFCQGVVGSDNYVAIHLPESKEVLVAIEFRNKREKEKFISFLYELVEIHDYSDYFTLETIITLYELATKRVAQVIRKDDYIIIAEEDEE